MLIHTAQTRHIPNSKKRHVTGEQRREFAKNLELQKGELFKRNLINTYQEYGEQAAPIIPNAPALNQIRYEGKKIRLGVQGTLWDSLKHLKHNNVEYHDVIRQVGFDKFFIFYWTNQQTDLFNDLLTLNPGVSLDATGSVVRKIPYGENYHHGPIFLYQIIIHIGSITVPVCCCQMLTERHDTKIIAFWLYERISAKAHVPPEVVADMSDALQNGICMAFCNMTYKQYLSNCYTFLMKKSKVLPRTYLRIDIAHLIHSVATEISFSSVKFVVKDFYLRAIGLMSTLENFTDIEKMMKTFKFDDTVIDYKNIKNSSSCEKQNHCDSHLVCHDEELENNDFDDSDFKNLPTDLDLMNYIDKLVTETHNNIDSNDSIFDDINPYYLVGLLKKLKFLFKRFPSWTNVMRKHYGSEHYVATSSRSESYFKYVKENTITPRLIEARAAYDKLQMITKKPLNKPQKLSEESGLNCQENWRNKNRLDGNLDLDPTEETISDNSINESEARKSNDSESGILKKDESKGPILNNTSDSEFTLTPTKENSISFNKDLNLSKPKFHSTPITFSDTSQLSNISVKKNEENSFSIVLDETPIKFKIHETPRSIKRKQTSTCTPCLPVKRGKYVVPFPSIKVLHQNAAAKNSKKK
ncbi:unnamed protein product [Euphydryas editha]|uniref:Transposase n=1 Tax=Euphydryas editha TaxID=104508 RepID=A0AAU9TSU6_EUPED|nr:unnamed protein product [Euphydryas editha]